jgi:hypothetical protein
MFVNAWALNLIERLVRWRGYELREMARPVPLSLSEISYRENGEIGAVNMRDKLERQSRGEAFEWPDIVALNQTVSTMIGDARRIVELGSGTGAFAWAASENPHVQLVCSEFDTEAHDWARHHRARPNIRYVNGPVTERDGPFDLVVTIEVVEHVADYAGFLRICAALAPKAIITTPNKMRTAETATFGPPPYYQHVREWTPGEFYWVLRTFYRDVRLFGMVDPYKIGAVPMTVMENLTPLIAVCTHPIR